MKVTSINEENIAGFHWLLGRFWDERIPGSFFMGALDDDMNAIAACACKLMGNELTIMSFTVHPFHREEGIGREFMIELAAYAFSQGIERLSTCYYSNDVSEAWEPFLEICGFKLMSTGIIRRQYLIDDILNVHDIHVNAMPKTYRIVPTKDLNRLEREALRTLLNAADQNNIFIDTEELFSPQNTLGGVLFFENEIRAAVYAAKEEKVVHLGNLLLKLKTREEINYLMDHIILQAMTGKNQPDYISYEFADSAEDNALLKINIKTGVKPYYENECILAYIDREGL